MTDAPSAPPRTLVLLAGPSGSGKSRLARLSGLPVLRLDDYYFDADHPGLPRTEALGSDDDHDAASAEAGLVDWDDVRSWNAEAACQGIHEVLTTGRTQTPDYRIAESRAVGVRLLDVGAAPVVLGEGIFAVDAAEGCRQRGIPTECWWLDRPAAMNFWRRLRRDLAQHRKPPAVLVRRGLALWGRERELRRGALAAGFQPVGVQEALQRLESMHTGANRLDAEAGRLRKNHPET